RRQTRVWRLNGNAQALVAVWPTAAECHLVDHRAADVVCVGDRNERTLVWRFGLVAGPTRPLAVRNVARRTGVSPDGRFVALWGKEDLVLVDLDRAEATRRPLPPDAGVPTHLVPLGDRLVALFRRPGATPVLKVYDTAWAAQLVVRHLKPEGFVVAAENCWPDPIVASVAGKERSVGLVMSKIGVASWKAGQVERGHERGGATGHDVFRAGEHDGTITPRTQMIAEILKVVDGAKATDNLWGERWSKLCANAMGNPVQAMSGLGSFE